MKTKLKLWLMMGLPSSGKSTYIEQSLPKVVVVSQDEIRRIFYGNQFFPNAESYVHGDAKNIVRLMLSQGQSVVVDSTAVLDKFRKEWKLLATEYDADFAIVFIDTPKEVCLSRNSRRNVGKRVPDDVIEKMSNQMQRPVELTNKAGKVKWWDFGEEVEVIHIETLCGKEK